MRVIESLEKCYDILRTAADNVSKLLNIVKVFTDVHKPKALWLRYYEGLNRLLVIAEVDQVDYDFVKHVVESGVAVKISNSPSGYVVSFEVEIPGKILTFLNSIGALYETSDVLR